jgi:hypothetical protein
MTRVAALAKSESLPKALSESHGYNWSWAYYETEEDAQVVCDAMLAGGNSKWHHGRCEQPKHTELGWVIHYHYDNYVSVRVDYSKREA